MSEPSEPRPAAYGTTGSRRLPPSEPPPPRLSTGLIASLGPFAIWVIVMAVARRLASPNVAAGECSGLGFGCVLSPQDTIDLYSWIVGVPVVVVATIIAKVLAARAQRVAVAWTLGFVGAVAVTLVLVLSGGQ